MQFFKFLIIGLIAIFTIVMFAYKDHKVIMRDDGIWIYEQNGRRCLSFSPPPTDINQTCIYLNVPEVLVFDYQKLMIASLYLEPVPGKILVMGLGGGTMVSALQGLLPAAKIDVVEINPHMVTLAEKYFYFTQNEKTHIFLEDAYEFVQYHNDTKYDLILFDIYDGIYIPQKFLTEKFMLSLKELLAENGVIAINTFINSRYSELEEKIFYKIFGPFYNLKMTNRVMISSSKLLNLDIIQRNSELLENKLEKIGIIKSTVLNKFDMVN